VLLVCGIANPKTIEDFLKSKVSSFQILRYKDHYNFHLDDVKKIKEEFSKIENRKKIILTTEKDAARLLKFEKELAQFPIYVLPMAHEFLFEEKIEFEKNIFEFVNLFQKEPAE
jgi:tetraacyldisaccharide 4'-kinase